MPDICGGAHRFFVATDGIIDGTATLKIYCVVVCTVCKQSHLIEHLVTKDATRPTKDAL